MDIREGFISYIYKGTKRDITFFTSENTAAVGIKIGCNFIKYSRGFKLQLYLIPDEQLTLEEIYLKVPLSFEKSDKIYLNGFQTWTDSREYKIDEKVHPLNALAKTVMRQYGDYSFYPCSSSQNLHAWTYTYVNKGNGNIYFFGSLTESKGYTLFDYDIKSGTLYIKKDIEKLVINNKYDAFELYIASGNENEIFSEYFNLMEIKKPSVKPCTGWTSWYNYYTGITEGVILNNLNAFKKRNIPIDTFQIDDGYQNAVGDWLVVNSKFPNGMGKISEKIKESGYKAGLWLAPFICEKRSILYKEHYEWVLKSPDGKPVKAGINPGWSGIFYALDFYNEGFRNYLREVFDTVYNKWGFDMVKLDFLYAAALLHGEDKPRGQIMYEAMKFLREISKDKIILGCGVPLGPSFGLVDYCRIGSDVALKWEDNFLKGIHYRERVSTINSISSTIGRRHLNGNVFYNDPDVFIIREKNNKLTKAQRDTLLILNLIFGGLVFTSDNIDEYTEEEFKKYLSLFPFKEKSINSVSEILKDIIKIDFNIEEKKYIVYSNLGKKSFEIEIEFDCYIASKGFSKKGEKIILEPYTTTCLLKIGDNSYEIAGSTGHVFPGSEVSEFKINDNNITLTVDKKLLNNTSIFIKVPSNIDKINVNGKCLEKQDLGNVQIVRIDI